MATDIDSVLKQMRREHSPTAADRERIHTALSTALLVGGAAGATHVATAAGAKGVGAIKGAALALPVWVKGVVGVGMVAATVSGGAYGIAAYQAAHEGRQASHASGQGVSNSAAVSLGATVAVGSTKDTETSADAIAAGVAAGGNETPTAADGASTPTIAATDERMSRRLADTKAVGGATARVHSTQPTRSLTAPPQTSLGELRLLSEASRALRQGRTEEARSALSEHERRYSKSALDEERAGLEILARCVEEDTAEGRNAAERFLRASPSSPLAGRVRRACLK